MKKLILMSIILIVGCDKLLEVEDEANDSTSQIMFVYAQHDNSYNDNNYNSVYIENTEVFGVIFSDPLVEFTYLKLNETVFSGDDYSIIYPGYTIFGENDSTAMITSNFTPLDVEVKTSQGMMNGTISLPDTIMTLGLSETSNLPLSTPFTISWAGSNADFYDVSIDYGYKDENENWQNEHFNEMTTDYSFTFPGSIFSYNGEINYITVQPINGTIPKEGAEGNMSGDGSGFLYYWANTFRYEGDDIIVGSGISGRISNTSTLHPNEQELKQRIRKKIENRILGIEDF